MAILGIRFSNSDYAYCILSGTRKKPNLSQKGLVKFPKDYDKPELMRWLHREIAEILDGNSIDAVAVKRAEVAVKRSNNLEIRIECGAIAALVAADKGCKNFSNKVAPTIAKDLGLKGKAKYLQQSLDTSPIDGFDELPDKIKDAVLVAWSCQ